VLFGSDGRVGKAEIEAVDPYGFDTGISKLVRGSSVERCVLEPYEKVQIPPFNGPSVTVHTSYLLE
jgi:hypothetical protein